MASSALGSPPTFLAQPKEREMIHIYRKVLLALDLGKQGFDRLMADLLDLATRPTNQVVVWGFTRNFVHLMPTANVSGDYEAELTQEVYGAIQRRPMNGRRFGPHARIDFVEGGVPTARTNRIQDKLALGRYPEALFTH